jgi:hypothetical protein
MGRSNEKRLLKLNFDDNALLSADAFPEWGNNNNINGDDDDIWVRKLKNWGSQNYLEG